MIILCVTIYRPIVLCHGRDRKLIFFRRWREILAAMKYRATRKSCSCSLRIFIVDIFVTDFLEKTNRALCGDIFSVQTNGSRISKSQKEIYRVCRATSNAEKVENTQKSRIYWELTFIIVVSVERMMGRGGIRDTCGKMNKCRIKVNDKEREWKWLDLWQDFRKRIYSLNCIFSLLFSW